MRRRLPCLIGLLLTAGNGLTAWADDARFAPRDLSTSEITKVLMLGTGNPLPDPQRNGPSIAVVVNETPYIFDAGEGIWRAMGKEMPYYGGERIKGITLRNNKATRLFITHLHNDHTLGVPALILGPWNFDRREPVHVYGPEGTAELVEHILIAYRRDIDYRVYSPTEKNDSGWRARAHEISSEGLVYEDDNVRVSAFKVCHGLWPFPIAYRIETPDRTVAISGDTTACEGMKRAAEGADILLHEVYTVGSSENTVWPGGKKIPVPQQMRLMHASTEELAELAKEIEPDLLVTYHEQNYTDDPDGVVNEIARFGYGGKVISARDGDIY